MTVQSVNESIDKSLLEAVSESQEGLPDALRELTAVAEMTQEMGECACKSGGG